MPHFLYLVYYPSMVIILLIRINHTKTQRTQR